jgi:hypothetical protein
LEERKKKVKSILVTLPKPENDKNPYAELAKKLNLKIDFRSFIHVEGVPAKDFRKEKILALLFLPAGTRLIIFSGSVRKCVLKFRSK